MDWCLLSSSSSPCSGWISKCSVPIQHPSQSFKEDLHLSELIQFALEWRDKAESLPLNPEAKLVGKIQACDAIKTLQIEDEQQLDEFVNEKSIEFGDEDLPLEQRFTAAYTLFQYLCTI
jgi:hypothetical protein